MGGTMVGVPSAGRVKTALTPLAFTVYSPDGRPVVLSGIFRAKGVMTCAQPRSLGLTEKSLIMNVLDT